jgi:prepilin-type N-terminal cleavage/methylation domain-containing protein
VGSARCRVAFTAPARSAFPLPTSHFPLRRKALTLVELMVAIAIMGILASLLLGAAAVASEVARNARSKSLIARLHTLLIERYDGYRNQRVELRSDWATYATPGDTGINFVPLPLPQREAAARLVGLRETMKFEMPDRWSDILGMAVPPTPVVVTPAAVVPPRFLQRSPALRDTYLRAYNRMVAVTPDQEKILENESAECLYLIIMNATGDGEARGMFKPNDIGDTDEDGAPEFVDGWGKPISFLRWAPGFDSDAQLSFASLERTANNPRLGAIVAAEQLIEDHDPFDLFRLDPPAASGLVRGWRLLPLIISGGGDEEIGVRTYSGKNYVATLDPYADLFTNTGYQGLGEATDTPDDFARDIEAELAGDDITNHNVGELSRK